MKGVLIMTILETTQKIDANKIFTCTRRTFTPTFKYKVVDNYYFDGLSVILRANEY